MLVNGIFLKKNYYPKNGVGAPLRGEAQRVGKSQQRVRNQLPKNQSPVAVVANPRVKNSNFKSNFR